MEWAAVTSVAATVSALAGTTGALVAAAALRRNREDQARRDAAGLHASTYVAGKRFRPGDEIQPGEQPSDRTDFWLVVKVSNSSAHPYYSVVTSVALASRAKRFGAWTDVVPPGASRFARLAEVDGCDAVSMDNDTLVETTYVDSQGRGWRRDSSGLLERREMPKEWRTFEFWGRPHRGVALHRLAERSESSSEGYDCQVLRDEDGLEVDLIRLEVPASDSGADDEAFPMPFWSARDPGEPAST